MKKVVLRGPVLTQSGYGRHAREIARWLLEKNDVETSFVATPWGDTSWLLNRDTQNGLIGKIIDRSISPEAARDNDVAIQLQLPNEWDPKFSRLNVGVTAAVETDICNPSWVTACNNMALVIVPSKHAADSLTNSGVVNPGVLNIVPESFSDSILNVNKEKFPKQFSTNFNFLIFGQITGNTPHNDRKNIFHTIKWMCEAFKDNKDVGLVVKTNTGKNSKIDRKIVENLFKQLISEVRVGQFPKIHLLHGDMTDDEIASLYVHPQIKAIVSLTRGEGYGLPILEAAASGLPVIATNWSGHLDFLSKGKFIPVDYQLGEVHNSRIDNQIFMKGSRWANASEQDFKKKIAKFYKSSSVPLEWAKDLQSKLLVSHQFSEIAKTYDKIFAGIIL